MDAMQSLPHTGRLLNAVIVLIVSLSSFSLGWSILKSGFLSKENRLFAYFWIATGFLWLSSTLRNIFAAYEFIAADKFFFYGAQLFLYISGVFLAPYLLGALFHNSRFVSFVRVFYIILGFAGFLSALYYGIGTLEPDFFSTKYYVEYPASLVPIFAMAPVIAVSILESIQRMFGYFLKRNSSAAFFSVFSILLYLVVGLVDQTGAVTGWPLLMTRLIYVAAFLLAYSAATREREFSQDAEKKQTLYVS